MLMELGGCNHPNRLIDAILNMAHKGRVPDLDLF